MTFDAILAIGVFSLLGLLIVGLVGFHTRTALPSLVAFGIRWTLSLATFSFIGLAAPDAIYYDATAMALIAGDLGTAVTAGKEGWPTLLFFLYTLFGHVPQLGLIVNATAGALTVAAVGNISRLLGSRNQIAPWIAALFPTSVLWSSLLLRESITWFTIALCGVGFLGVATARRVGPYLVISILSLAVLLLFRGTVAISVLAAGLVAIAYVRRKLVKSAVLGLALSPLVYISPLGARIDEVIGGFSLEGINTSRESLSTTATTGWPYVEVTDIGSTLHALGAAFPRVIVGPFPWEWMVTGAVLALDAVAWVALLALAIRGLRLFPERRQLAPLLLPAAALLVALIVTSGNYGTMQRLRLQPAILLIPIASVALSARREAEFKYLPHYQLISGPTTPSRWITPIINKPSSESARL